MIFLILAFFGGGSNNDDSNTQYFHRCNQGHTWYSYSSVDTCSVEGCGGTSVA